MAVVMSSEVETSGGVICERGDRIDSLTFGSPAASFSTSLGMTFLRIGLRDLDVSFCDLHLNRRRVSAINDLIDLHPPCGGICRQWEISEIICDLSMRSFSDETKGCFGRQKDPRVSLADIYLRRKFPLFPPIVRERERAAVHRQIQGRETVTGENPAVV